ncbi:hypothetical protein ABT297_14845 [Dactylosporangium sp. NPDC000555]|uniref:hypothetical protein n=1 Tax=Dactylosporangium sp. NPDC000555 TaxID=3154260 RepID=UPI00332BD340
MRCRRCAPKQPNERSVDVMNEYRQLLERHIHDEPPSRLDLDTMVRRSRRRVRRERWAVAGGAGVAAAAISVTALSLVGSSGAPGQVGAPGTAPSRSGQATDPALVANDVRDALVAVGVTIEDFTADPGKLSGPVASAGMLVTPGDPVPGWYRITARAQTDDRPGSIIIALHPQQPGEALRPCEDSHEYQVSCTTRTVNGSAFQLRRVEWPAHPGLGRRVDLLATALRADGVYVDVLSSNTKTTGDVMDDGTGKEPPLDAAQLERLVLDPKVHS